MPDIEQSDLHQKAVYWAASGEYDEYGEPKVNSPIEISVRWEYVNREGVDPQGNTVTINAIAVVDRDIAIGSVLWLGSLRSYNKLEDSPTRHYVQAFHKTPDVKNRAYRRTVELIRLSTELPTSA